MDWIEFSNEMMWANGESARNQFPSLTEVNSMATPKNKIVHPSREPPLPVKLKEY